jgi:hypothetical protein
MNLGEIGFGVWVGFMWIGIGAVAGFCEHGNEPEKPKNFFTSRAYC